MLTRDFDYHLPATAIAQHPAPRGHSRLLVLDAAGEERHRQPVDLPSILRPGDLLVVNDTRVLRARIFGRRRPGGGRMELLLAEKQPAGDGDGDGDGECWDVLAKPGKRARPGTQIDFDDGLAAEVVAKGPGGRVRIRFSRPVEPHLQRFGHVPLPPYLKRPDERADHTDYQTIFARNPGAIAAPTAGLHFTPELVADLAGHGIGCAAITLHVGLGTFKPVTAELVHEHHMEAERYLVPEAAAAAIRRTRHGGGSIVAVGTTVVRTLETAAAGDGEVAAGEGRTKLYVTPGFRFRAVDVLLTNFHLPRSTLLMLVSAFAGRERVLAAYEEAIANGYRFYSYGDAMLAERRPD
ncbi:MAG: tRNA preQ1(34) S-adenosylmethionine ribosyltransferase-isomerase QueA [Thermoanaerobaculia bacterium]